MASSSSKCDFALSYGALKKVLEGEYLDNIVLQILGYKSVPGTNNDRFRLLLSDGVILFPHAILATELNHLIYDKNLEKFTIFKLKSYADSQLSTNKKVIICIDIEIIVAGSVVNEKICKSSNAANVNEEKFNLASVSVSKPLPEFVNSSSLNQSNLGRPSNPGSNIVRFVEFTSGNRSKILPIDLISSISPYRSKWMIKARLIYKSKIYNSKEQEKGRFFSMFFIDSSGQITATAFNESAAFFFFLLDELKVYMITNAHVKPARESIGIKCDFELIIRMDTIILPCGDDLTVPRLKPIFNFTRLYELKNRSPNQVTDVIGICSYVSDVSTIIKLSNIKTEVAKRSFTLFDMGRKPVNVTLWDTYAENCKVTENQIIAITSVKKTDSEGCSLILTPMSRIFINPTISQTAHLQTWFKRLDYGLDSFYPQSVSRYVFGQRPLNNWKIMKDIYDDFICTADMPIYCCTTKATIIMVAKEECLYRACTVCRRKVKELNDGLYRCNNCNKNYDSFSWTLVLNLKIADHSGSYWSVAFKNTAENLLGMSAEELSKIKSIDENKFHDVLSGLNSKSCVFKLRAFIEISNEGTFLMFSILCSAPVCPVSYTHKLMKDCFKFSSLLK